MNERFSDLPTHFNKSASQAKFWSRLTLGNVLAAIFIHSAAGENFDLLDTKIVDSSCKKRVLREHDHLKSNVFLKSSSVLHLKFSQSQIII